MLFRSHQCSSRLVTVLLGTLWSSIKQNEARYVFDWENAIVKALIREKLEGVISLKSLYDLFISLFPTPCNVNNPREGGI